MENLKLVENLLNEELTSLYLDNILLNLPINLFWMDKEGRILSCSANQAKIFGLKSSAELVGKNIFDVANILGWDQSIPEEIRKNDLEIMHSKLMQTREEVVFLNGEYRTFLTCKSPLFDKNKVVIGIFGFAFDITDRKNLEAALQKAKEKAETADEAKTEFIRNLEHDIRTPLSGMYLLTSFLAKEETEPKKREILQSIEKCTKELMNYCNGIIDLVYAQSGANPIAKEELNLSLLLERVVTLEKPPAIHKNLQLIVDYPDHVPKNFIGDAYRLERILINLTSNAIKFTLAGYVKISVKMLNEENAIDKVMIVISVTDTGIGVPIAMQERIFERFFRLAPSDQKIYKGTGLGLSVVKIMVEELKGQIKVESCPDQGSIFTCSFPMQLALTETLP